MGKIFINSVASLCKTQVGNDIFNPKNEVQVNRIQIHKCIIDAIAVYLTSKRETAECPICGKISNKVNKKYIKTLNDMPTLGKITRSIITIHKYCCTNEYCKQKTFLEPTEDFVILGQRRTIRLNKYLEHIAMTNTGEGGSH